jgi:hypothetical protein
MTAGCVGYRRPHFTGAEWLALINECGSACLSCGEPVHP